MFSAHFESAQRGECREKVNEVSLLTLSDYQRTMNEAAAPVVCCRVKTLGLGFYTFSTAETIQSERRGVCVGFGDAKQPPAEKKICDKAVVDCVCDSFVDVEINAQRGCAHSLCRAAKLIVRCSFPFLFFIFFILG